MATADSIPGTVDPTENSSARLLVLLAAMPDEHLQAMCAILAQVFSPSDALIAVPETISHGADSSLRVVKAPQTRPSWTLTAADFDNAHTLATAHAAEAIILLGPEAHTLQPSTVSALADAVLNAPNDLALPAYDLSPRAGLVNSAILFPVTRALFATKPRYPLAVDVAFSARMAAHMANAAQRFTRVNQGDAQVWPLNEAAVAGFTVTEVPAGERKFAQPEDPDLNKILPLLAGSLFSDVEAKAAFWQRPRQAPHGGAMQYLIQSTERSSDTETMIQAFRLAYTNLQEIWSLVLPPNALLGLKRLSLLDASDFRMPDNLWARIVYDFLLAWRLRTINRGHLLGALVPLYLAWVASHFHTTESSMTPEQHVEAVAAAFEAEKPYLVSRWRWPDRFNP
ncbi:MAG: hypothetical protein KGN79_03340 [Acidobacteriota bacterium]|nr:hypothetical protein [Acidobacteriota bacterium]